MFAPIHMVVLSADMAVAMGLNQIDDIGLDPSTIKSGDDYWRVG